MKPSQKTSSIPRPYADILVEINRSLTVGQNITLDEIRGACRFYYSTKYNRSLQDLMSNIGRFIEYAGFQKVNGHFVKTSDYKETFDYKRSIMVTLMSIGVSWTVGHVLLTVMILSSW